MNTLIYALVISLTDQSQLFPSFSAKQLVYPQSINVFLQIQPSST